jgi:inosine-uridine nucleoside N-ribohydrolase
MGGGVFSGGNVTEFAEANIWNDPHAADEVFAADWEVTVIGLDVTQKVVCARSDFSKLANKAPVIGGFLAQATDFYIKFYQGGCWNQWMPNARSNNCNCLQYILTYSHTNIIPLRYVWSHQE